MRENEAGRGTESSDEESERIKGPHSTFSKTTKESRVWRTEPINPTIRRTSAADMKESPRRDRPCLEDPLSQDMHRG